MERLGPGTAHGAAILYHPQRTSPELRVRSRGVGRKFPVAPMLGTAVCVAAANVLLAYVLARMLFASMSVTFGPLVLVALVLVALASGADALYGWRAYLRRRG